LVAAPLPIVGWELDLATSARRYNQLSLAVHNLRRLHRRDVAVDADAQVSDLMPNAIVGERTGGG
jgi:hypothetical protein